MRKNDLIKILESLKGSPEIVVWNGFVEDVQQIGKELVPVELHKLTFEGYKERINLERVLKDKLSPLPDEELKTCTMSTKLYSGELFSYYPPAKGDKSYRTKQYIYH